MLLATKLPVASQSIPRQHPQMRFVSTEAIALCLSCTNSEIYRVDCWRYVAHVVGKGISTFVSYADLPPILGVVAPVATDARLWRKRWRQHRHLAPRFWVEFYAQKFQAVTDLEELAAWDELVAYIHFGLTESDRQFLATIGADVTQQLSSYAA
jgi:hypothetical protein